LKTSVIIVSYNSIDLLERCMRSVYANTSSSVEILVADNGSTDGSTDGVQSAFPKAVVIKLGSNLGFSKASNAAARRAGGEYLVFLNPDTEVRTGALDYLAAFLDERKDAGIAGPRVVYPDNRFQVSAGGLPNLMREFRDRRMHQRMNAGDDALRAKVEKRFRGEREVGWVTGSCLAIRRNLFEELGGFDEGLFMYFEDKDLCKRAREKGWKAVFVPKAEVVHVLGGCAPPNEGARLRAVYRKSQQAYYKKHLGPLSNGILRLYQAVSR